MLLMRALQALLLPKWSSSRVLVSAMPPPSVNTSAVVSFMRAGSGSTSMATCWSNAEEFRGRVIYLNPFAPSRGRCWRVLRVPLSYFFVLRQADRPVVIGEIELSAVHAPGGIFENAVDFTDPGSRQAERDDLTNPHHDVPAHDFDTGRRECAHER
jgi:hypothetical protein